MRTHTSESLVVIRVSRLVSGEEEIHTTLWPVHIAGTVIESLHPANPFIEILEQMVELIQIIST
jgi:hypothetical protein